MNINWIKSSFRLLVIPFLVVLTACSNLANASGGQSNSPTQPSATGNPSVTVNNQDYDGTTVKVADVFSQGPGWMTIHKQTNGTVGDPIGHTHLNPGDNKNVAVTIDPTQATPVLYAMLHKDVGIVNKYEFPGVDAPVYFSGVMVSPKFTATVRSPEANITPSLTVINQDVSQGQVIIASVTSRGPGWVAIHTRDSKGQPGAEIGYAAVKSGLNTNVSVPIDQTLATPVMFAMLHQDVGTVGKYEYPNSDPPQLDNNGQMVAPPFQTSASAATSTSAPQANNQSPTPGVTTTAPAETPTADMGMVMPTSPSGTNPLVNVSDQPLFGGTVLVGEVVSAGPGWIVIYTINSSGQPDQPIGHTAVKDGDNQGVLVQVDPAKAVGTLYAQLHVDVGKVGTFEYPGVDAPVMMGVQMIASTFKITSGSAGGAATPVVLQPSISVADQEVVNGTVTIPQVVSNGLWWLVIHKQNPDGKMGEYVGATLLKNGVNSNVVVKIDVTKATPVLYAMLHEDHGIIGTLEFPGPDTPVNAPTPAFNVTGLTQDVSVNIQKVSDTVSYLTDSAGMSFYINISKSACTGDCLTVWKPVLVTGKVIAGSGVNLANLGVITLPDKTHQVTYLGAPLYTFVKDTKPGDTNGQGVQGVWFLVAP